MIAPLNRNLFLIRQHAITLTAAFEYDVLDPETGEVIMVCRENKVGPFSRIFRLAGYKATTPFNLRVTTPTGKMIARVARGIPVAASKVRVFDENDRLIGGFRQKIFSFGGAFDVVDATGTPLCHLNGGFMGRNFRFVTSSNVELATVIKKWSGIGKEFLTTSGDLVLQVDESVPSNSEIRRLIFASVICIGIVLKIEIP